jgi:hypothetical protein
MVTPYPFRDAHTALVIAHPGHELRLWHWLESVRPVVLVITDGSGFAGVPRIHTTERLLLECGAARGDTFGTFPDRRIYKAVLEGHAELFAAFSENLAAELVRRRIECVVGDAAEGQIMAHDLFREARRTAVQMAEDALGWRISEFEFAIDSPTDVHPPQVADRLQRIILDEASLARKLAVARNYQEVQEFVVDSLEKYGPEAFAVECLFPSTEDSLLVRAEDGRFPYEVHGEKQVRAGRYADAIRYTDHVWPIIDRLRGPRRNAA